MGHLSELARRSSTVTHVYLSLYPDQSDSTGRQMIVHPILNLNHCQQHIPPIHTGKGSAENENFLGCTKHEISQQMSACLFMCELTANLFTHENESMNAHSQSCEKCFDFIAG